MNDGRSLLNNPIFLMGAGLVGARGQPRGLMTGLELAQQANYQNALMDQMRQKYEMEQKKQERTDQALEARRRMASSLTAIPVPGQGPIASDPRPAYTLNQPMVDMAMGAPDAFDAMLQAKMTPSKPKLTDDITEYLYGKQDPEFEKFLTNIKAAGAIKQSQIVNTGKQMLPTRDEILREDTLSRAAEARDFNKSVLETGYTARGDIAELEKALELLENVETGPFEETLLEGKKIAGRLGLDIDWKNVSNAEQLRVLLGNQVMARVAETKGAVSEKEMDLFRQYSANYGNTPEGNRKIIQFQKRKAQRDIELMKIVVDMRKDGKTSPEIQNAVMDYVNKNDLSDLFVSEDVQPDPSKMTDEELLRQLNES